MSDINNTGTLQPTDTSQPPVPHDNDPLDIIVERIDSMEVQKTERNEIHQHYDEARAHATADKAGVAPVDQSVDEVQEVIGTIPDPSSSPGRDSAAGSVVQGWGLLGLIPGFRSRITAASQVQDPKNPEPPQPEAGKLPVPFQSPKGLFALPIPPDLSAYPPELKCEGLNWWILFNPSPTVKRVLDLILVHRLVYDNMVCCVTFSPNENWFATASNGTVRIYDMKTGASTCILPHPQYEDEENLILCICFSPDGKYIASGADDGCIRVWNIAEKQICTTLEAHDGEIETIHYLSNGFLISAGVAGDVLIWDTRNRTSRCINSHRWSSRYVAVSRDDRYVAMGGSSVVTILEVATGAVVEKLKGHTDKVSCVAFTPDGKGLMAGYFDGKLNYWDISGLRTRSGACSPPITWTSSLMKFTNDSDSAGSIVISPDGKFVASQSHNNNVLFWDARTRVEQFLLRHTDTVSEIAFSPTGEYLATACASGVTRIWRLKDDYRGRS